MQDVECRHLGAVSRAVPGPSGSHEKRRTTKHAQGGARPRSPGREQGDVVLASSVLGKGECTVFEASLYTELLCSATRRSVLPRRLLYS